MLFGIYLILSADSGSVDNNIDELVFYHLPLISLSLVCCYAALITVQKGNLNSGVVDEGWLQTRNDVAYARENVVAGMEI